MEPPEDVPYYGGEYVVVPLVQDVLDDIEQSRGTDGPIRIMKGVPEPAVLEADAEVTIVDPAFIE